MAIQTDIISIQDHLYKFIHCPNYFIKVDGVKYVCALVEMEDASTYVDTTEEITPSKDKELAHYITHLLNERLYTTILLVGTSRPNLLYLTEDVKTLLLNLTNLDTITFFYRDADEMTRRTVEQVTELVDASMQEKYYNLHKNELQATKAELQSDYESKITNLNTSLSNDYNNKITTLNTTLSSDYDTKINNLNTDLSTSIGNEVIARSSFDTNISSELTTTVNQINTNISTSVSNLSNQVNSQLDAQASSISANQSNISTNASNISSLTSQVNDLLSQMENKIDRDEVETLAGSIPPPDYSRSVEVSSGWLAPQTGWIRALTHLDSWSSYVYIDGVVIQGIYPRWLNDWSGWGIYSMNPIAKGQKVTFTNSSATFFYCIGS